ncbi:pirin family protein [Vibrio genomosp. F10]|uniref:Quercetin 2,3-dioxygenase n=1 Tax=Vibrio genomosp. F10 str. ZF-129 TaxID=1187848 RepID=A0A1E5BGX8_9VIBR|nr:pirin family protein [Vibrio genomosp. F10]OEE35970.1 quercetin 2,3-dioxygenase [Vibrio genomosp. F10 str. ZF-129]OEE94272.1 quercetin 2,3-dioxygenase [Vibrio genomosp. F10 str. 9ZC157]OEE96386.1 quercetin 2,3-dioxygenase [Vibrio genomosp. F10 str. 9ZD137]OEF06515.1 quercetin 2,3-dioxygenase [Vibrio genomosp. F10 str. 9ZB36]
MNVTQEKTSYRPLTRVFKGIKTSDGDGVKLTRIIGTNELNMLDPFLLLDCFESDQASDYIGGFPTHPHRGFETVTYLHHGNMRHKDSAGHEGVIRSGGVQWMTAGKGILHSEMPEQDHGLLKGFQLWVNLPQTAKMVEPDYQEFLPEHTPLEQRSDGVSVRVISGETDHGTKGPVNNTYTSPLFLDVTVPQGGHFEQQIPAGHNAFIYVVEGSVSVKEHAENQASREPGRDDAAQVINKKYIGIFGEGEQVFIEAHQNAQFLLLAGQPLNEPVARSGPFVMNTREELMQAYQDYNNGLFT